MANCIRDSSHQRIASDGQAESPLLAGAARTCCHAARSIQRVARRVKSRAGTMTK